MKRTTPTVKGPRRIFFICGLTLLLLLLFAGGFLFLAPLFERDRGEVVEGSADWMGQLPDHLKLNEINIPGTHDSAACFVQMAYFTKCQNKTISGQLQAGFRYLDIRLAVEKDRLILTHGSMRCKRDSQLMSSALYLEDVLQECRTFLQQHPTEAVLFCVKQESGEESTLDFQNLLHRYINTAPSVWLLTDSFPTLEEARGKLVLLRRYEDASGRGEQSGIDFRWEDQGNREQTELSLAQSRSAAFPLWVQDRYHYESDQKWTAFLEGLKQAPGGKDTLSLHFLSTAGSAFVGHPYGYAKDLNKRFLLYEGMPDTCAWVIMDFGTAPLAAKIYERNLP
ncbi:MAG: phosphatidylinositol-specific phospholipase C domain-containing protein [Lachnospiraceae bacterium]|nr:phosphatidylinositol-specific phospholipase C domain-containing protein [Lachnospiraceae bacterium]